MLAFWLFQCTLSDINLSYSGTTLTVSGKGVLTGVRLGPKYTALTIGTVETFRIIGDIYTISKDGFQTFGIYNYDNLYKCKYIQLENIETIPDYCFGYSFDSVETIDFGSRIRYIGANWLYCNLQSITIPKTVERLSPDMLRYINSFQLDPENKFYSTCTQDDNQYLLYKNKSTIFGVAGNSSGIDFRPPDCIIELDTINMPSCSNLLINSIDLNKVEIIKAGTFDRCTISELINEIDLSGIKRIEDKALSSFVNITEFNITSGIEYIGVSVFPKSSNVSISSNTVYDLEDLDGVEFLIEIQSQKLLHANAYGIELSMNISNDYILSEYLFSKTKNTFTSLELHTEVIPLNCFEGATIKFLDFGDSVHTIQENAFYQAIISNGNTIPRTITSIKTRAFYQAIVANTAGSAWCTLEVNFDTLEDETFRKCLGIQKVYIIKPNITLKDRVFNECSNILDVDNIGDGSIKHILGGYNFYQSTLLRTFNLTDDIETMTTNTFNQQFSYPFLASNGILLGGTTKLVYSFSKTNSQTGFIYNDITHILSNAFNQKSGSSYSFNFPALQEIQAGSFNYKTFDTITFGATFTMIKESCLNGLTVNSLIFEADTVEIASSFYVKFISITLPNHFIFSSSSIIFDLQATMTCSLSTSINNYSINNDEIILSDERYEQPCIISTQSNVFNLVIKSTVRYIGSGFFDSTSFSSVTIDSGIETLLSLISSSSSFIIPESVTNILFYSYSSSSVTINSGTTFVLQNDFLMNQSTTELIGCYDTADITNLPSSVTKLGPYSLSQFSISEFIVPTQITHISEYALPSSCTSLVLNNNIESLMRQSSVNNCSFIPASLQYIDYSFLTSLAYPIVVEAGCAALNLINSVWYHIDEESSYTTAVSVQDPNARRIDFEYDKILSYCVNSINNETVRKITNVHNHSDYASGSSFSYYERLCGRIQNFWDYDYNQHLFACTNITGKLRVPVKSSTTDGVTTYSCSNFNHFCIPYGVIHIYAAYKPASFNSQLTSPWIHVPPNSSLTYSDFGGYPLVYDWINDSDADDDEYDDCNCELEYEEDEETSESSYLDSSLEESEFETSDSYSTEESLDYSDDVSSNSIFDESTAEDSLSDISSEEESPNDYSYSSEDSYVEYSSNEDSSNEYSFDQDSLNEDSSDDDSSDDDLSKDDLSNEFSSDEDLSNDQSSDSIDNSDESESIELESNDSDIGNESDSKESEDDNNIIDQNTKILSSGAVAGIVIACAVFVALIAFLAFYCLVLKKANDKSSSEEEVVEAEKDI